MGDVVNLNKYRKNKAREARTVAAAQNRLKHGESKSSRALRSKKSTLENKHLDGHKLKD